MEIFGIYANDLSDFEVFDGLLEFVRSLILPSSAGSEREAIC